SCFPKAIQLLPLGKHRGLGRVQVFRLARANQTPAKSDEMSTCIANGKSDARSETIVTPSVFGFDEQAHFYQEGRKVRVVVISEYVREAVTVGFGPAQAVSGRDATTQTALLQIGDRLVRRAQVAPVCR